MAEVFLWATWRNSVEFSTLAASRASFAHYARQPLTTKPGVTIGVAVRCAIRYGTPVYPVAFEVAESSKVAAGLRLRGGRRLRDSPGLRLAEHARQLPISFQSRCPRQRLRDLELLRDVLTALIVNLIGRLSSER